MKLINFDSHIKKLQGELDLNALQNDDIKKEQGKEDPIGMKDLINKKRKSKKRKKTFEYNEDLLNEQMELFEKSKMENMQNYLYEGISTNNINPGNESIVNENNSKLQLDIIEKDLFSKERKSSEEEINFD